VDDCCDTDNSVGDRAGEQLHDGRVNLHPAGNCHYRSAAQHHSGAKTFWIKEGYQPNQVDNRNEEQNENKYTDCHHLIAIGIVAFAYQGITYTIREKLDAQLEEWNVQIALLKARAEKAKAEGKIEYYKSIEALQHRQDKARAKLHEMKTAGDEAWEDLKTGAEKS